MEFHEKLQELRKSRGLTQEELAEALFVSRTAISKWESGRGYPSIDSLKNISAYFSVSIDDLLSGEQLIFLAEKENHANLSRMCGLLFGIADLFALLLIFLPLYPKPVAGCVYAVNLIQHTADGSAGSVVCWVLFLVLTLLGIIKIGMACRKTEKGSRLLTVCSIGCGILSVLVLLMARVPYAGAVAFLLLLVKGGLLYRQSMTG